MSSHILDPFTPIHMAPIFTTSYFCDINTYITIHVYNYINTFTVELNSVRLNFGFPALFISLFACFVDFFLCILSLTHTQTCRPNCRTPLSYMCTYKISQFHCFLSPRSLSFHCFPGDPHPIPGPSCSSLAWLDLLGPAGELASGTGSLIL